MDKYINVVEEIIKTYNLPPLEGVSWERIIENYDLGFFNENTIRDILINSAGCTEIIATKIISDLNILISKSEAIQTASGSNQSVPPLRTMAGDVDKVHGYGAYRQLYPDAEASEPVHSSSQDISLGKNRLAPMPEYKDDTPH